jgi:PAS domain S-box-containing protein
LARERAILQYVVDNVPYCIFWKDRDSRYLGCNKNFAALDGLADPREIVGKTDYDTAWRAHAEAYRRFDRETMDRGIPLLNQEEVTQDDKGRQMVILTSKVPLRNEAGDVIGLLGIIVDITQRKQIEQDLSKAKEQAELALRSKNAFLANISHELRTPLTLVRSPLESLLSGDSGDLSGAARAQVERAHRNALRLLGMVEDLLDFSRLEAGKQDVLREPTDVGGLCASIVDDAQSLAGARGLTLDFQSNLPQAVLLIDRGMLEKITLNLVGNALKFTPPGGAVTVSLGQSRGCLELGVADTGIGIDSSSHERVFERFAQVDPAATRRYGGMGLGLALVKEFAELMGGSVTLESELGKGARFLVRLPFVLDTPLPITSGGSLLTDRRLSSLGGSSGDTLPPDDDVESTGEALPRVLLVEDNTDMRGHLTQLLRGRYRVSTAGDGKQALNMMRTESFDVVLSDVMMPELDGLSLVEIVKSDEQLRHLPIILITARSGKDALVSALEAGADDYIAKPFSPAELRARVRAAYRLGHAHRRMAQLEDELRVTQARLERAEARAAGPELDGTRGAAARRRIEISGY